MDGATPKFLGQIHSERCWSVYHFLKLFCRVKDNLNLNLKQLFS
ncbi:hypothetical protein SLEP1_g36457 [Rubroshorea leprosula]|uniref:Uncharacterized protein n=1 Tax=Rubroshorea leprosula TaxID=152421 RepID=A0AAV5KS39_9ROSI|nr:hypothetical protein SLEP1_g36457 [Rubroshorea leprosula]